MHRIKLVKIKDIKFFFIKLRRKCKQNYGKEKVGKMKKKIYFVVFSNACSIFELMLFNRNLTK